MSKQQGLWRNITLHFLPELEERTQFEEIASGFSGAVVVRVITPHASYALRCWPPNSFPYNRIQELHRFLGILYQHGLPVAVPIPVRKSGQTLFFDGTQHWQLEPWLSGVSRQGETITSEETTSSLQTLARLHGAAEKYVPTPAGREWFAPCVQPVPAIRERIALINEWTPLRWERSRTGLCTAPAEFQKCGHSILEEFRHNVAAVAGNLQWLSAVCLPLFPCWRDVWSDHILFESGRVTGLIDPSAARVDHPATDLSRFLGSLFKDDQKRWKEGLAAYQQIRTLSLMDQMLIVALDQSSVLLSGMTWIERWEKCSIPEGKLPAVTARLVVIERRIRNLSRSQQSLIFPLETE